MIDLAINDTYQKIEIIQQFVKSKDSRSKAEGNIDMFLGIYDLLMTKENLIKVNSIFEDLS